eukprot:TRINITY_DN618_c0_g1_i12.p1 TRINITY_DN618_c0_g1~~TRINITY_DN618_c0_g1_i12.p1  ORF type:complete len:374 (-),score=33.38 TRINITY_DN618_c0_g1_i12:211-1332(-)
MATPLLDQNGTDMGCPYFKGMKQHCLVGDNPHLLIRSDYVTGGWSGYLCGGLPPTNRLLPAQKELLSEMKDFVSKMEPAETSLAGLSAGNATFIGITTNYGSYKTCNNVGIIGMAYANQASDTRVTLWDFILQENQASGLKDIFSIGVCRYDGPAVTSGSGNEVDEDAGVLVLGGSDPAHYTGELQWTPITHETLYCVRMLKFGLHFPNGTASHFDVPQGPEFNYNGDANCSAVIDSGNDEGLMLAYPVAAWISPYLQRIAEEICPKAMHRPCNTTDVEIIRGSCAPADLFEYYPSMSIELDNGVVLTIPPEMYYTEKNGPGCMKSGYPNTGRVLGIRPYGNSNLGQTVLESYYTVFDRGNKRIGFAPRAGCN